MEDRVLPAALLLLAFVFALLAMVFRVGDGDFRRGRLRALRRIRATRRRLLRPRLGSLALAVRTAWTRPVRASVAAGVRRVADRLERTGARAGDFTQAEHRLSMDLERMEALGPGDWSRPPETRPRRAREAHAGRGWVVAAVLLLAGALLGSANAWALDRFVLPVRPGLGLLPAGAVPPDLLAALFGALPFLFGLVYFALAGAGKALGYRALAVVVALLVLGLAVIEGTLVVTVLEDLGIAQPTWWGGVAVATLIGGAAALAPATTAVLSHAAAERLGHWIAARDRRAAGVVAIRQDRLAGQLRGTLDELSNSVRSILDDLRAIRAEPAGRLVLATTQAPSVERTIAVLHRAAAMTERDQDPDWAGVPPASRVFVRLLGDLGVLTLWVLASIGAVSIAAAGLLGGAGEGLGGSMAAAALACLAALLLAGVAFRAAFAAPAAGRGSHLRAAAVLLLGVGTLAFAAGVGPLAAGAGAGPFEGQPLRAAAWLELFLLAAALASIRLPEGIGSVTATVGFLGAAAGWLAVSLVDRSLAALDWALRGGRPRSVPADRIRARPGHRVAQAIGAARD